jgi:hypothetical protein
MTHKALIRQLEISCLGLDRIDPLCLLVDDVIAALTQTERTWVGLTDEQIDAVTDAQWRQGLSTSQSMQRIVLMQEPLKPNSRNSTHDRPPSHRLGVWPDWLEWVIPFATPRHSHCARR